MNFKHLPTIFKLPMLLFLSLHSLPSQAELSDNVNNTMIKAQDCRSINKDKIYINCMLEVNTSIKKLIKMSKNKQLGRFTGKKANEISHYIERKSQKILQRCLSAQAKRTSAENRKTAGERRHLYCIYENMLELLINIEGNIELYSQ